MKLIYIIKLHKIGKIPIGRREVKIRQDGIHYGKNTKEYNTDAEIENQIDNSKGYQNENC